MIRRIQKKKHQVVPHITKTLVNTGCFYGPSDQKHAVERHTEASMFMSALFQGLYMKHIEYGLSEVNCLPIHPFRDEDDLALQKLCRQLNVSVAMYEFGIWGADTKDTLYLRVHVNPSQNTQRCISIVCTGQRPGRRFELIVSETLTSNRISSPHDHGDTVRTHVPKLPENWVGQVYSLSLF